jgi:hypothetical protein
VHGLNDHSVFIRRLDALQNQSSITHCFSSYFSRSGDRLLMSYGSIRERNILPSKQLRKVGSGLIWKRAV